MILRNTLDFTFEDSAEPDQVWFSALDLLPDKDYFYREFFSGYVSQGIFRPRDRFTKEVDLLILDRLAKDLGKKFAKELKHQLFRQQSGESVMGSIRS